MVYRPKVGAQIIEVSVPLAKPSMARVRLLQIAHVGCRGTIIGFEFDSLRGTFCRRFFLPLLDRTRMVGTYCVINIHIIY